MFYQAVHKFWIKKGVNKKKNSVTWIENERNYVVYIERRDQLCTFLSYPGKENVEIQRIMTPWKMSHIHSYKKQQILRKGILDFACFTTHGLWSFFLLLESGTSNYVYKALEPQYAFYFQSPHF